MKLFRTLTLTALSLAPALAAAADIDGGQLSQ